MQHGVPAYIHYNKDIISLCRVPVGPRKNGKTTEELHPEYCCILSYIVSVLAPHVDPGPAPIAVPGKNIKRCYTIIMMCTYII